MKKLFISFVILLSCGNIFAQEKVVQGSAPRDRVVRKSTSQERILARRLRWRNYNYGAEQELNAVQTQLYLNALNSQYDCYPTWHPMWYPNVPFYNYWYPWYPWCW